jgi:predicted ArsR family transcriptional regulator
MIHGETHGRVGLSEANVRRQVTHLEKDGSVEEYGAVEFHSVNREIKLYRLTRAGERLFFEQTAPQQRRWKQRGYEEVGASLDVKLEVLKKELGKQVPHATLGVRCHRNGRQQGVVEVNNRVFIFSDDDAEIEQVIKLFVDSGFDIDEAEESEDEETQAD